MRRFLTPLVLATLAMPAFAEDDYIRPVQHPLTQEECSACHMAYPPSLLPARSWSEIMNTLDDHFGEDASLGEEARAEIEAYLVSAAGDANGRRFRAAPADETPLRITDLPWFNREHKREVSTRMLERAGSMSNCSACHRGAERGYFEDD
ncbi:diheme cytochrome c [Celeribacter neptunius]|uniref:Dihaem cytochrome c n=1 Tax=Celeribacter neptunius TaxID=588602 RepID=A0A1I3R1Q1_9RHOB|nr:diheme cytochrome c [Celeribacter neptunius]SFJ39692.1 Dihaem cytochrome c [Celeribacter neptunius]